ncbi:RagB/SusD family nutrient uptake outer membrane protein [Pedobacter gandavensis]|uniref:RagB/SusD family nutrient uptake outer membrane protein n=1 Tax=Pedobacter gandavensis TaxID=2679963 RepID=A0ABR6F3T0_9SPHI|nr:RagB/SusD family nutrient uptake outer membrane protein [Pedobacter gandavensis]MBB2151679.1 RagB/SusD family nutrient uptake outer membrane protein [Pedobacter gandavensis]
MKKIYYTLTIGIALILGVTTGCKKANSFLDSQSTNDLDEVTVFADSARTSAFLLGIYGRIGFESDPVEVNQLGAPFTAATDEAESRWPGGQNVPIQMFQGSFGTGFINANNQNWTFLYTGIRMVNIYLKNVDNAPLSANLKAKSKMEARFLRAYFYHFLLKFYGGVQLVGDDVKGLSDENVNPRASFEATVNYIVSELDAVAAQLPLKNQGLDYGRVTKGAALALKARVLLSAASPLFNGGSFATDASVIPLTAYPTADASRWQKAMEASKAVMDLNQYQLVEDNITRPGNGFYKMFLDRVNSEAIFQRMLGNNKLFESNWLPPTRGGTFLIYPSQQLVDAFPMKNGKLKGDPGSGFDAANPYANRDPRLDYTVIYNGAMYFDGRVNAMAPVFTYVGAAQDGIQAATANTATNTGYYCRKMCDELIYGNSNANAQRCQPLIRYAEVLLNYAEAANESGQTNTALDQLIALRKRAGILAGADFRYGIPSTMSQIDARSLIQNERFIELAFEEQRYFDLRRWRLGADYDGKFLKGMRVTKTGNNYTYAEINVRTARYFKVNSYLFPIPVAEISINREMKQNPGW